MISTILFTGKYPDQHPQNRIAVGADLGLLISVADLSTDVYLVPW